MSQDASAFLVNVPALQPASAPQAPAGIRFLNPGVFSPQEDGRLYTPGNLPMDGPTVKAMLAQFAQLARESRSVADVSAFASGQYDDFYSGTSFAVRTEIESARQGKQDAELRARALSKAQTELCLAWSLEDYARELGNLGRKLDDQWAAFSNTLGLDEEETLDDDQAALAGARPDLAPDAPRVPFGMLLGAMLAFVPEGAGLYCADPSVLADWEEYGVSFREASPEDLAPFGLSGKYLAASAPGHLLCLSKRADPARPWLDAPRLVVAPAKE